MSVAKIRSTSKISRSEEEEFQDVDESVNSHRNVCPYFLANKYHTCTSRCLLIQQEKITLCGGSSFGGGGSSSSSLASAPSSSPSLVAGTSSSISPSDSNSQGGNVFPIARARAVRRVDASATSDDDVLEDAIFSAIAGGASSRQPVLIANANGIRKAACCDQRWDAKAWAKAINQKANGDSHKTVVEAKNKQPPRAHHDDPRARTTGDVTIDQLAEYVVDATPLPLPTRNEDEDTSKSATTTTTTWHVHRWRAFENNAAWLDDLPRLDEVPDLDWNAHESAAKTEAPPSRPAFLGASSSDDTNDDNKPSAANDNSATASVLLSQYALSLGPAGAVVRLHTDADGRHVWLAVTCGRVQVALYGPADHRAIYASESLENHSFVDPFAPDLEAYPLYRAATPLAATLMPGDVLIVPAQWYVVTRALSPHAMISKEFYAADNAALHARASVQRMRKAREAADANHSLDGDGDGDGVGDDDDYGRNGKSALEAAETFKIKGNTAYARACFREATAAYGRCLEVCERALDKKSRGTPPDDIPSLRRVRIAALANRLACAVKRKAWHEGIADANEVVRGGTADPIIVKVLYRRGQCHAGVGDATAAEVDFKRAFELDPTSVEAKEAIDLFKQPLHRVLVESRKLANQS
ncbi:JmjC domain-containing protein [Pseudoscourfieldia marina]